MELPSAPTFTPRAKQQPRPLSRLLAGSGRTSATPEAASETYRRAQQPPPKPEYDEQHTPSLTPEDRQYLPAKPVVPKHSQEVAGLIRALAEAVNKGEEAAIAAVRAKAEESQLRQTIAQMEQVEAERNAESERELQLARAEVTELQEAIARLREHSVEHDSELQATVQRLQEASTAQQLELQRTVASCQAEADKARGDYESVLAEQRARHAHELRDAHEQAQLHVAELESQTSSSDSAWKAEMEQQLRRALLSSEQLEQQLEAADARFRRQTSQLQESEVMASELRGHVRDAESEGRSKLRDAETAAMEELRRVQLRCSGDLREAEDQVLALRMQVSDVTMKLGVAERATAKSEAAALALEEKFEHKLQDAATRRETVEAALAKATLELEKEREISAVRANAPDSVETLSMLRQQAEDKSNQVDEALRRLQVAEDELKRANHEVEARDSSLATSRAASQSAAAAAAADLEAAAAAAADLGSRHARLEQRAAELEQQLAAAQRSSSSEGDELAKRSQELEDKSKAFDGMKLRLEAAETELKRAKAEVADRDRALMAEQVAAQTAVAVAEAKLEAATSAAKTLESRHDRLEDRAAETERRLERERAEHNATVQKALATERDLRQELGGAQSAAAAGSKDAAQAAAATAAELVVARAEAAAGLAEVERQAHDDRAEFDRKLSAVNAALADETTAKLRLQERVAAQQEELEEVRTSRNAAAAAEQKNAEACAELRRDIESERDSAQLARDARDKEREENQERVQRQKEISFALRHREKSLATELGTLREEAAEAARHFQENERLLKEKLEQAHAAHTQHHGEAEQALKGLRDQMTTLDKAAQNREANARAEVVALEGKLARTVAEIEVAAAAREHTLQVQSAEALRELQIAHTAREAELLEAAEQSKDELRAELAEAHRSKIADQYEVSKAREAELNDQNEQHENELRAGHTAHVKELRRELEERVTEKQTALAAAEARARGLERELGLAKSEAAETADQLALSGRQGSEAMARAQAEFDGTLRGLRQKLAEMAADYHALQTQHGQEAAQHAATTERLAETTRVVARQEGRLQELADRQASTNEQTAANAAETEVAHAAELQAVRLELERLEERNAKSEAHIEAVQLDIGAAEAQLADANKSLRNMQLASRGQMKRARKEHADEVAQLNAKVASVEAELERALNSGNARAVREIKALYETELAQRKLLHNRLREIAGNIRVFARVRHDPRVPACALEFPDEQADGTPTQLGCPHLLARAQTKRYEFDRVFAPSATQRDVFEDTEPLITSCIDGYNVAIMAYGQTGSGKTFTMMGTDDNPGVNRRAIHKLIELTAARQGASFEISVALVEIYLDKVTDLLSDKPKSCAVSKGGLVAGVTEVEIKTAGDVFELCAQGERNRSVAATSMNSVSSRSHLLLWLTITGVDRVTGQRTVGKLTLVDLAGSERVSKSHAKAQQLAEANAINKSLASLGQVFNCLRTGASHIPYVAGGGAGWAA